ncbi:hypothetical protein FO519_007757 [Halicephalobus sp. NKZ332]|nr:hypothetical protein FO519_007757 [Halicephalobus sp. NKZ332]
MMLMTFETPFASSLRNSGEISLHLFFEKFDQEECPEIEIPSSLNSLAKSHLVEIERFGSIMEVYPVNFAKNIARKGVAADLFISGEIEEVFVENFESRIFKLAKKVLLEEQQQTVLVYRRFEISEDVLPPRSKNELKFLLSQNLSTPFNFHLDYLNHKIPNLDSWLDTVESPEESTVTETMNYRNFEWVPRFLGDSRTPFHDERWPSKHCNNLHLSFHLCFMNFTFSVASDVFSTHIGFRTRLDPVSADRKRLVQKVKPWNLRRIYRDELDQLYPGMKNKCFGDKI